MTPTYASLVRRFGLTFRPYFRAYQYAGHPAAYPDGSAEAEAHDAVVRIAFANFETGLPGAFPDPYDAALAVWREDGLLGAGDPGPPEARRAHEAYLQERVIVAASARDWPDAPRPSEVTFTSSPTGRPRVSLPALLDAIDRFRAETHPLLLLSIASDDGAAMIIAREARDRLVAWFAERGVDVVP